MLPKMAFTGFTARYREPSLAEGFEDIAKIDFKVLGLPHLSNPIAKYLSSSRGQRMNACRGESSGHDPHAQIPMA